MSKFSFIYFANLLAKGDKWQFDIPVGKQLSYCDSLPEPKTDNRRSFNQYLCQMLFVARWKKLLMNFFALFAIPIFICIFLFKTISTKFKYQVDAIVERSTHQGVIPAPVSQAYSLSDKEWCSGASLSLKDCVFCMNLFQYLFRSPYFVFKVICKIAQYSHMITAYRPKAIVVYGEYSFTSSAVTAYCEYRNVTHIDVMHGEKLYYVRDSFFRFSKTYVWDDYYVNLFQRMRAPISQFIASLPPFMKIKSESYINKAAYADSKYYLATYNEEEIKGIIESMKVLRREGKTIKFRPHPRYSNIALLKKYVVEAEIEMPADVDIMTSIANCKNVVGLFTTVLNQGLHSGKDVILDDVNFPHYFNQLSSLGYVLVNKTHKLLSKC